MSEPTVVVPGEGDVDGDADGDADGDEEAEGLWVEEGRCVELEDELLLDDGLWVALEELDDELLEELEDELPDDGFCVADELDDWEPESVFEGTGVAANAFAIMDNDIKALKKKPANFFLFIFSS